MAMKIILQESYGNYKLACSTLSAQTLEQSRIKLCLTFAAKNLKSDNSLFTKVGTHANTRQKSNIVKEFKCIFGRY